MTVADPSGHMAHGMAQNTPTPTFGGKSLDEVVKEAMQESDGELEFDSEEIDLPPTPEPTAKPKNKGGRPRKA
jgi:hypothetical protein